MKEESGEHVGGGGEMVFVYATEEKDGEKNDKIKFNAWKVSPSRD